MRNSELQTFAFVHRANDLQFIHLLKERGQIRVESHINICLNCAAYQLSIDAGYASDISLASSYSSSIKASWKLSAIRTSSVIGSTFRKSSYDHVLWTSYLPRIVDVLAYINASVWLVNSIRKKYPNANCVKYDLSWRPFVPASCPPINNPDLSCILPLLASPQSLSLYLKSHFKTFWLVARDYLSHLRYNLCEPSLAFNRIILKLGVYVRRPSSDVRVDELRVQLSAPRQHSPKCIGWLLSGDLQRTLDLAKLVKQRNKYRDRYYFLGKPGFLQSLTEERTSDRSLPPLRESDILEIFVCRLRFGFFLCCLAFSLLKYLIIGHRVFECKRLSLAPVVLFSLLNLRLWDDLRHIHIYIRFKKLFRTHKFAAFLASEIDTPDVRMVLSTANKLQVPTISFPHAYLLEQTYAHMYVASQVYLHGLVEHRFVTGAGIESARVSLIGASPTKFIHADKTEIFKTAIILSNSPSWAYMPPRILYRSIDRLLELHCHHDIEICLKLHPVNEDAHEWIDLALKWNATVDQTRWGYKEYSQLGFSFFIGHPGSSILNVAQCMSIPAVVIPWNDSDRQLFDSYELSCADADQAMEVMMRSRNDAQFRQLLLDKLTIFLGDCVGASVDPIQAINSLLDQVSNPESALLGQ